MNVRVATEARLREATTLTAGASTSVRSGAGLTLVSVGAPTTTSLTPIASRPCLVMRSAMGPASASRRQARSEPLAQTSSSSPLRMSLSTALRRQAGSEPLAQTSSSSPLRMSLSTALRSSTPVTFVGRSTPRSSRREAADRMTSWVSVSFDIGILHCVGAASFAAATTTAPPRRCSRRGRIPEGVSRARNGRTTALFAAECQSFLDNLIAGLGQIGAWNDAGAFPACTAVLVLAKGERPQPWLADRRGSRLHDSADDDAIADHVDVDVVPLAGRTGGRGALEG